jgi:hypothetical protein
LSQKCTLKIPKFLGFYSWVLPDMRFQSRFWAEKLIFSNNLGELFQKRENKWVADRLELIFSHLFAGFGIFFCTFDYSAAISTVSKEFLVLRYEVSGSLPRKIRFCKHYSSTKWRAHLNRDCFEFKTRGHLRSRPNTQSVQGPIFCTSGSNWGPRAGVWLDSTFRSPSIQRPIFPVKHMMEFPKYLNFEPQLSIGLRSWSGQSPKIHTDDKKSYSTLRIWLQLPSEWSKNVHPISLFPYFLMAASKVSLVWSSRDFSILAIIFLRAKTLRSLWGNVIITWSDIFQKKSKSPEKGQNS